MTSIQVFSSSRGIFVSYSPETMRLLTSDLWINPD